jgi:hypothetical protein
MALPIRRAAPVTSAILVEAVIDIPVAAIRLADGGLSREAAASELDAWRPLPKLWHTS